MRPQHAAIVHTCEKDTTTSNDENGMQVTPKSQCSAGTDFNKLFTIYHAKIKKHTFYINDNLRKPKHPTKIQPSNPQL